MTDKTNIVTLKRNRIAETIDKMIPKKHPARIADAIVLHRDPLSAQFDNMGDQDFQAFAENVRTRGIIDPHIIIRVDDKGAHVVDGWHRVRAAADTDHATTLQAIPVTDDAAAEVVSRNLHRRHLSTSQRAALTVTLRKQGKTQKQAAEIMGIGVRTVKLLDQALKKAPEGERDKWVRRALAGDATVSQLNAQAGGTQAARAERDAKAETKRVHQRAARTPAAEPKGNVAPGPNLSPRPPAPRDPNDRITDARARAMQALAELADLEAWDAIAHVGRGVADALARDGVDDRHLTQHAVHVASKAQARNDRELAAANDAQPAETKPAKKKTAARRAKKKAAARKAA